MAIRWWAAHSVPALPLLLWPPRLAAGSSTDPFPHRLGQDQARGQKAVGDLARALSLLVSRQLPADGGPQVSTGTVLEALEPLARCKQDHEPPIVQWCH